MRSEEEIRNRFEMILEGHDKALRDWLIKHKARLTCLVHSVELEPPEYYCSECEKFRNDYIRQLRAEGWSDDDFRKAGWRKFENVK